MFEKYRTLSRRDKAYKDVVYVINHFFVASVTLGIIGVFGGIQKDPLAPLAMFFCSANLVAGLVLTVLHNVLKRTFSEGYEQIITSVLGTHDYPLLPLLLSVVVAASLFLAGLYVFAN